MAKNKRQSPDLAMTPGGKQSPDGSKVSVSVPRPGEGSSRGDQKAFEDETMTYFDSQKKETDRLIKKQNKSEI